MLGTATVDLELSLMALRMVDLDLVASSLGEGTLHLSGDV